MAELTPAELEALSALDEADLALVRALLRRLQPEGSRPANTNATGPRRRLAKCVRPAVIRPSAEALATADRLITRKGWQNGYKR